MSWVTGATRNYPDSLKIRGDMTGKVKFVNEPKSRNFGKKTLRDGSEVDDIRHYATVEYLGGSAMYDERDVGTIPAVEGTEYTLWLSKTLIGGILDEFGWSEGEPVPNLAGTSWEIWREGRDYKVSPIGDLPDLSAFEADEEDLDEEEDEPVSYESNTVDTDGVMDKLRNTIKTIKKIPKEAWETYVTNEGLDPAVVNPTLESEGLIEIDETTVKVKE